MELGFSGVRIDGDPEIRERETRATVSKPNILGKAKHAGVYHHGYLVWRGNEETYNPLEKAWGVRMVRPLAIEMTRFDSIWVRCILKMVEEGVCSEQCGISPFPLRRFRLPVMPPLD